MLMLHPLCPPSFLLDYGVNERLAGSAGLLVFQSAKAGRVVAAPKREEPLVLKLPPAWMGSQPTSLLPS